MKLSTCELTFFTLMTNLLVWSSAPCRSYSKWSFVRPTCVHCSAAHPSKGSSVTDCFSTMITLHQNDFFFHKHALCPPTFTSTSCVSLPLRPDDYTVGSNRNKKKWTQRFVVLSPLRSAAGIFSGKRCGHASWRTLPLISAWMQSSFSHCMQGTKIAASAPWGINTGKYTEGWSRDRKKHTEVHLKRISVGDTKSSSSEKETRIHALNYSCGK